MIFKRHYDKEIIDDFSINDQRIDVALDELNTINFFLGGNSISRRAINYILFRKKPNKTVKILDVGAGGSDLFHKLKNQYSNLEWVSADMNLRACKYGKQNSINQNSVCCNAFKLPFKEKSVEIVHASLFIHHFSSKDILELINCFCTISSAGLVINDLRRNVFAYLGIRMLTMMFSRSDMVKNDGPLSVKKGFIKNELKTILNQAGIQKYIIKRRWAFRWMIIILIDNE